MVRIGLDGFGRIGRVFTRIALEQRDVEIVVINELDEDVANLAYLLKYDSLYGRLDGDVVADGKTLVAQGRRVPVLSQRDIRDVRWEDHGVDVVIEATGVSANADAAHEMVSAGRVSKVVVTNAHKRVDTTIVVGVNDHLYDGARHHVVSSSICDANAVAPLLHRVDQAWGVEAAFITTLHPWLSYQNLLDGPISSVASPGHAWRDYSLGRASVINLIPKDTTAGNATCAVLPQLAGVIEAISFRVPTITVSLTDLTVLLKKNVTVEQVNNAFKKAVNGKLKGILDATEVPLVSSDYIGNPYSAIVDLPLTNVVDGNLVKVVVWYDNEWGYANRLVEMIEVVGGGL